MARTVVVSGFGTFVGKRSERLLLRPGIAKARPKPRPPDLAARDGNAAWGIEPAPPLPEEATATPTGVQDATTDAPVTLVTKPEPAPRLEQEIPLFQVGEIVLPSRGVTVSVELLAEAAERGITISFLSRSGKPWALLSSPMLTATVSTRRAQLHALDDARGVEVCRKIVSGKLRNQAGLLGYFAKGLAESERARKKRVLTAASALRRARNQSMRVKGATADKVRDTFMGIEGAAARCYWDGVAALCEGRVAFPGRKRQGDVGPVNAVLNYGYGILYSRVWAATLHAGLDPFAGFLHTDRPGKPSLVLDLVEELRAPVVDRAILAYIGLGRRIAFEGTLLDEDTRKAIAAAVIERLEARVRYRGRTLQLGSVLQHQARSLAVFLRGEGEWRSFTMYW